MGQNLSTEFLRSKDPAADSPEVVACARAVSESNWAILAGVRALVDSTEFRKSLGKGLAWPLNLVQGVAVEGKGMKTSGGINKYRDAMGQAFAFMPDVSGYDIFKLYGDTL